MNNKEVVHHDDMVILTAVIKFTIIEAEKSVSTRVKSIYLSATEFSILGWGLEYNLTHYCKFAITSVQFS
jgi:hypothetical protein